MFLSQKKLPVNTNQNLTDKMFVGELSLSGKLRPIKGALSIAILAKQKNCTHLFLPEENAQEASVISNLKVIPAQSLKQLVYQLQQNQYPSFYLQNITIEPNETIDMSEVR